MRGMLEAVERNDRVGSDRVCRPAVDDVDERRSRYIGSDVDSIPTHRSDVDGFSFARWTRSRSSRALSITTYRISSPETRSSPRSLIRSSVATERGDS